MSVAGVELTRRTHLCDDAGVTARHSRPTGPESGDPWFARLIRDVVDGLDPLVLNTICLAAVLGPLALLVWSPTLAAALAGVLALVVRRRR